MWGEGVIDKVIEYKKKRVARSAQGEQWEREEKTVVVVGIRGQYKLENSIKHLISKSLRVE